jgi:cell division protein FtsB
MLEEFDPNLIQDEYARQIVIKLLNLVESSWRTIEQLRDQNQQLRDEVNRLKGERANLISKLNLRRKPPRSLLK